MTELRADMPPLPERMRHLPLDRGFPVPFFVPWVEARPDFRGFDDEKLVRCLRGNLCWLCGKTLGRYKVFAVGPMCAVNRVSSEPPSHSFCAEFAVQACPWLSRPHAQRRGKPDGAGEMAGIGLTRNPGVTLLWTTARFRAVKAAHGGAGLLFEMGEPERVEWWREGRAATAAEVQESIDEGTPALRKLAEEDGGVKQFETALAGVGELLPA